MTQKQVIEKYKATKGSICMHSFENGKRCYSYSGLDMVDALHEVSKQVQQGRQIVLTGKEGDRAILRYEIDHGMDRISFEEANKYAKQF